MAEATDQIGRRVLVVDDERNIRRTLQMVLEGEGYSVEVLESAEELLPRLSAAPIDLIMLDVRLPGMDGLAALEKIREDHHEIPVVMISGHATLEEAVRAMATGASDFLEKPLSRERVLVTVKNAIERRTLSAKVRALEAQEGVDEEMIGDSDAIKRVKEQIHKVAATSVRVLITGESGTGKELIARAIHRASKRANGPFVKVNCAAIPSELIESELFGHERGAFSGAVQKKRGRFELADSGTLFLDEIGDMSVDAQAKVLRVLQTGEVIRVGGEKVFVVDVRVVAATNKDLEEEVKNGNFREDLYFRLSVVPVTSPPLRDRGDDVLILMRAYLEQFSREHAVDPVMLAHDAAEAIARYSFPGNVRELRNLAERLVILAGNPVKLDDLPPQIAGKELEPRAASVTGGSAPTARSGAGVIDLTTYGSPTLRDLREAVERDYILRKLEETGWNVTRTAEILGIERTNLHKKLKQLGVKKSTSGSDAAMSKAEPFDWRQLAELGLAARLPYVAAVLEERGFVGPQRMAESFSRLLSLPIFVIAADRVLARIADAASPSRALLALEDAIEALESTRGDASPLLIDEILRLFVELAGASGRAARLLSRDPLLAVEFGARFTTIESTFRPDYANALARINARAGTDTEVFDKLIRRYRNRQMLRIALRELREGDVRATSGELADLAAASMQAALDHHYPMVVAELGTPDPACAHVIMGMGKLGGRELNFSSDIDVLYFYEHDDGRAGESTLHQFFVKLFGKVTQSIARISEQGLVFRVDLDLRPEGKSGAIANSLHSTERYYETWGRTWERAAWIKGRPIAGSEELGARILKSLRPFVWRKSFDLKAIEEIFDMKTKIDTARAKAARASSQRAGVDLKLGKGGIREIELFTQSYQLLHGGRDQNLRSQNTLEALASLEAAGHVSRKTRVELSDAYLFLRRLEHRVQIVEEQQTHVVPIEPEAASAIARSLGFDATEKMHAAIAETMNVVHQTFVQLLGAAKEEDHTSAKIDLLLDDEAPEEQKLAIFSKLGARDPHSALASLKSAARHPKSMFHPHANDSAHAIARRMLDECCASPSVDRALKHLPELSTALFAHASYLEELARPTLRRGIARVLGASDLLARILVTTPALLPHVLLAETLPPPDAIARDIETRLEGVRDIEEAMVVLRTIKQEEVLRTAIADLAGAIETVQVNERLTRIAEQLIARALRLAEAEMYAKYGEPQQHAEMVIVAGGSLGAYEMGYRSDVDLSFVYDGDGETTGGERAPITTAELYTRIAHRLLSFLSLRLPQGDLYPADMRLRPSGNQGVLVISRESFEQYHEKTAQLWERQSLVRARAIAGAPNLIERVEAAIARAAYEAPVPSDAAEKIHEMRLRMEKERSPRRHRFRAAGEEEKAQEIVDLKLGEGGIVEAEFLVQYLLIRHGGAHPEIRTPSTRRALASLAGANLLKKATAERVIRAYDRLRTLQNWLRIAHDEMLDHLDLSDETLRPLALSTGYAGDSAETLLRRDLLSDTTAIHLCYEEVLGISR